MTGFIKSIRRRLFKDLLTRAQLFATVRPVDIDGTPQINPLTVALRDIELLRMNCKSIVFDLLAAGDAQLPVDVLASPSQHDPGSHPCRQADFSSPWLRYWLQQLRIPIRHNRKLWEYAFICQSLHVHGMLAGGSAGIGFGCGEEPLPSLFAVRGCTVLATDAPVSEQIANAWAKTGQHAADRKSVFDSALIDEKSFQERVTWRAVDMNRIPDDLQGKHDFCWSTCALEHLGSIAQGLDFILASLRCLRPGGVAVHTTEFNFAPGEETIDNWMTVLFKGRHLRELADRARQAGATLQCLDLDVGNLPLDRFIDIPPYAHDLVNSCSEYRKHWERIGISDQLKLGVDGFPVTCVGLCLIKDR